MRRIGRDVDGLAGPHDRCLAAERGLDLAVEDAQAAGRQVGAGPLPVAHDVGLLDDGLADVLELLGGHDLVDGPRVGEGQGPGDESVGQVHGLQ